jgi:hypothetical protein
MQALIYHWSIFPGCFVALSSQQQIADQVAVEGLSTNIIIPCTLRLDVAPLWIINGSVYELFSIPQIFLRGTIPEVSSFAALVIPQVFLNLTGLTFQCASFGDDGTTTLGAASRLVVIGKRYGVIFKP